MYEHRLQRRDCGRQVRAPLSVVCESRDWGVEIMTENDKADDLEQDLNHAVGNTDRIVRAPTGRDIVPSGHAPRLETLISRGYYGVIIAEQNGGLDRGAYIKCENPVDTREWL